MQSRPGLWEWDLAQEVGLAEVEAAGPNAQRLTVALLQSPLSPIFSSFSVCAAGNDSAGPGDKVVLTKESSHRGKSMSVGITTHPSPKR